jgi:hypothetical protein
MHECKHPRECTRGYEAQHTHMQLQFSTGRATDSAVASGELEVLSTQLTWHFPAERVHTTENKPPKA